VLRVAGLCLLLPLLFAPSRSPPPGSARVMVLDAGRGAAALIVTHRHVVLFDTGDEWNTRGSRAARVVIPALDALAVGRIDQLILPRLDADRAQGAALLAHGHELADIVVGGGWPGTSLPARPCRDEHYLRDGIEFQIFAAGVRRDCVLRISVAGQSMFFAGDLDTPAEHWLLARFPPPALSSEVVLMSRGASARASDREWIEASGARLALAAGGQAGAASRQQTLARWQDADVQVIDVLREGDVEIGLGAQGFAVLSTARSARYPFAWRRVE
jgi:competence protein ComEC